MSESRLDSSFASFVNPTETAGEEELFTYEMVFNNKALNRILGVQTKKDLYGLIMKPLFVNREHGNVLSLQATVNKRYSDSMLNQAYKFVRKEEGNKSSSTRNTSFDSY